MFFSDILNLAHRNLSKLVYFITLILIQYIRPTMRTGRHLYARYLCSRDAPGYRPSAARDDRVSSIQGRHSLPNKTCTDLDNILNYSMAQLKLAFNI